MIDSLDKIKTLVLNRNVDSLHALGFYSINYIRHTNQDGCLIQGPADGVNIHPSIKPDSRRITGDTEYVNYLLGNDITVTVHRKVFCLECGEKVENCSCDDERPVAA